MTAPHASHPARQRGYGLVEMLVAFTVMSIVIAVSFMALTRSQSQTASVTSVAEERQMARTAIQLLEREARMAGSGWGRNTVYTGGGVSLQAVNPQYGGAARNDLLMRIQACLLGLTLERPPQLENTAVGAACLAGIGAGLWRDPASLRALWQDVTRIAPGSLELDATALRARWQAAVSRAKGWARAAE